ncbi:MAG: hypothetical protein D6744_15545, partial [Planctomycetota bacterium]
GGSRGIAVGRCAVARVTAVGLLLAGDHVCIVIAGEQETNSGDAGDGAPADGDSATPPDSGAAPTPKTSDPGAPMSLSAGYLNFGDDRSELHFEIAPVGVDPVNVAITADAAWLEVSPSSSALSDQALTIDVRVNRGMLAAGSHIAQVNVTSDTQHELTLLAIVYQPDPATLVSDEQLLAWMRELPPLPKTHYSFTFDGNLLKPTPDPLAVEYVRITRGLALRPTIYVGLIRPVADLFKQLDAETPSRPCSLGMVHSPWHIVWPKGLPPTYTGPEADEEIDWFRTNLANAKAVLDQVNAEKGTNLTIDVFFFDSEVFKRKEPNDPNAAVWNAALDAKYDAMYDIAKQYFPNADVEWYNRGGIHRCNGGGDGWCETSWFSGDEKGDNFSVQLYSLPEYEAMQESFRRTVANAQANGVASVTPWIALGAGYERSFDDGFVFNNDWDYNLWYSWQIGAEVNHPWYAQHPDRFAPWDYAKHVMLYPPPFDGPNWGKHFVAYVRGAHRIQELPQ